MGRAGRAIVEAEFAWPAVAAQLLDVYRELLPAG
jgi:glycosyltransferase involved in cell wall biosynthesis